MEQNKQPSRFTLKKPVIKYLQTEVSLRHDGRWAGYVVLTWADLDMVSPDDTFAAIAFQQPWRNPLKWVVVGTSPTKESAIAMVQEYKRKVMARSQNTGSPLNLEVSPLEEELSFVTELPKYGMVPKDMLGAFG